MPGSGARTCGHTTVTPQTALCHVPGAVPSGGGLPHRPSPTRADRPGRQLPAEALAHSFGGWGASGPITPQQSAQGPAASNPGPWPWGSRPGTPHGSLLSATSSGPPRWTLGCPAACRSLEPGAGGPRPCPPARRPHGTDPAHLVLWVRHGKYREGATPGCRQSGRTPRKPSSPCRLRGAVMSPCRDIPKSNADTPLSLTA